MPGTRLTRAFQFVLPGASFRAFVWPVIADHQQEYVEAVADRDERRARWVAIRLSLIIWRNVACAALRWAMFWRSAG